MKRISVSFCSLSPPCSSIGRQTISDAAPAPDTELPPITRPADDGTDSQSPEELAQFLQSVENDVNEAWATKFEAAGRQYTPAGLQLYVRRRQLRLRRHRRLRRAVLLPGRPDRLPRARLHAGPRWNLGAPGDFAKAYVVAHEVGHHVQNLLGVTGSVDQRDSELLGRRRAAGRLPRRRLGQRRQKRGLIENGDLDEGLNAAASVGDDVLMAQAGQTVNPDNFTHGSAEERASWLLRGFNTGSPDSCDTFSAA